MVGARRRNTFYLEHKEPRGRAPASNPAFEDFRRKLEGRIAPNPGTPPLLERLRRQPEPGSPAELTPR